MQHLMGYLLNAYADYIRAEIRKRLEQNLPTIPIEEAMRKSSAERFARWAADHLQENRVAEQFNVDENHGIKLASGVTMADVCPPASRTRIGFSVTLSWPKPTFASTSSTNAVHKNCRDMGISR